MKIKILLLLLLSTYITYSDPYTDYILKAGASLNGNIYSSDFNQIGTFRNCCPKYESAFGLAPNVFAGAEYRNLFNLFGYDMSYSFTLGYNDISARYNVEQYIGNLIGEDNYQKILVEHNLDITLPLLSNEHAIWFNPVSELPLGIKFGVNLGIPLAKSFDQRELLKEPNDATFPDGSREFNATNNQIPDVSALFFAVGVGARYQVAKFDEFDLFANVNFNYGINNTTSNLDWKIHQLSLGVTLHYNIPKSAPPRPPVPPAPPIAEPVAPVLAIKPEISLETEFDYKKVSSGDTLKVTINRYEYNTYLSLLPVIVFERNSQKILSSSFPINNGNSLYSYNLESYAINDIAEKYPQLVSNYIKSNPGTRLHIVSESMDEDKSIVNERLENTTQKLIQAGVDKSIITAEIRMSEKKKDTNPALLEESRRVIFEFSSGGRLIEALVNTEYKFDNFNKVFNVKPIFKAEPNALLSGKTIFNNSNEVALKEGVNQVVLASNMFKSQNDADANVFEIFAQINDGENSADANAKFFLTSEEKLISSYYNLNRNFTEGDIEEYILGYMDFDKTEFSSVNNFALDRIRAKAAEGRAIELIPLTDNIGTTEYNKDLASKRAKAAINLIGDNFKKYSTIMPDTPIFDNGSPYGRMMNRSVIVRIK